MAKAGVFKGEGYMTGNDAAYIKPKMIPDEELVARDDSGGPDFDSYTQQFGDGGFVTGDKAHLSASGGSEDTFKGSEVAMSERKRAK